MKIHRFYTPEIRLEHGFWLKDERLLHQWTKVLRFRIGQQVVLFNGLDTDRLYSITEINSNEAHLELVTDYSRKVPKKDIYLFWSVLKKDKNERSAIKNDILSWNISRLISLACVFSMTTTRGSLRRE